jgi:hypothetical protein
MGHVYCSSYETEWAYHLLVSADDVNLSVEDIDYIKNMEPLLEASKEVGLEVNLVYGENLVYVRVS